MTDVRVQTESVSATWLIYVVAGGILLVGHFVPWAAHHTAALTLSAHDLAVFTNDTPGAGVFLNEWFLLPLWASALLVSLGLRSSALGAVLGLGIAALGLPSYPDVLVAFREPEHFLHFYGTVAVGLGVCLLVVKPLSDLHTSVTALVFCLAAAIPLIGYLVVYPFIQQLYGSDVGLGLGWWMTLVGVLVGVGGSLRLVWKPQARGSRFLSQ